MKCLLVGVYEQMYESYLEIKNSFLDLTIDYVLYKDLNPSILSSYDFLVSRGGVKERLENLTNINVFDIGISVYDILNTIDLNKLNETLIMGFKGITASSILLKKYSFKNLNIITINNSEEINNYIEEINKYKYIYCGYNTYKTIQKIHTNTSLILSSNDTIIKTINDGYRFTKAIHEERLKEEILKASLTKDNTNVIIYDKYGNIIHKLINYKEDIELINNTISSNLKSLLKHKNKRIVLNTLNHNILIYNSFFTVENNIYTSIKVEYHNSEIKTNYIYQALNSNLFKNYTINIDIKDEIKSYSANNIPLVIYSNKGSITFLINDLILKSSLYKNNTSFEVSFKNISKANFNALLSKDSFLIYENHVMILRDLGMLDTEMLDMLFKFIKNENILRSNKIIFNVEYQQRFKVSPYLNKIPYYLISLKPLDDMPNKEEIINDFAKCFKIKLTNDELRLLYNFSYNENELQLIRILNQYKEGKIISLEKLLINENYETINSLTYKNKSLENIILEAIHYNLNTTSNNHTLAAKNLQISRSTLWRYLKK